MTATKTYFIVNIPYYDETSEHEDFGTFEKAELTPEIENDIIIDNVKEFGTGTEEGYVENITKATIQKLKKIESLGTEMVIEDSHSQSRQNPQPTEMPKDSKEGLNGK